jgi:hypothetical protein
MKEIKKKKKRTPQTEVRRTRKGGGRQKNRWERPCPGAVSGATTTSFTHPYLYEHTRAQHISSSELRTLLLLLLVKTYSYVDGCDQQPQVSAIQ